MVSYWMHTHLRSRCNFIALRMARNWMYTRQDATNDHFSMNIAIINNEIYSIAKQMKKKKKSFVFYFLQNLQLLVYISGTN